MRIKSLIVVFLLLCFAARGLAQAAAPTTPPATASEAETAATQFEELFGERVDAVTRSQSSTDDLALARAMLQAAALDGISDALRRRLAEQAYPLAARDAGGFDTADAALDLRGSLPGVMPLEVREARAGLYLDRFRSLRGQEQLQFAGDAFNALRALAEAQESALQLDEAQLTWRKAAPVAKAAGKTARKVLHDATRRLATKSRQEHALNRMIAVYDANPRPDLASRIARSYLIDFNAPDAALLYAAEADEDAVKRYMPMLAGPPEALPTDAAIGLGEWLESLLPEAADDASRAALLRRADTAYSTFLERATEENFAVAKARLAQTRVAEALEELGLTTGHISGGIDLMPSVGRHLHLLIGGDEGHDRHWSIDKERKHLVGAMGNRDRFTGHPLNLPLRATGDYVLNLRLSVDRKYAVIVLPVGDKLAQITYYAGPETQIGGEAQQEGEEDRYTGRMTLTAPPTEPGRIRKLTFDVRTRDEVGGIVIKIDDQIAYQWQGRFEAFSVGPTEKFELASQFAIAPPRSGQMRVEAINAKGAVRLLTPAPNP